ncbi:MAG TPA: carboxyl-terminal protease, partial [Chitinophagaceae bacterium]|nr:carboxyl-terminal protease [Chitinophagaceae bacterium]
KSFAARDSIAMDAVSVKDKQVLLKRMQALMARQIWRNEGYFEIMNRQDMAVQKALQVLQAKN